VHIDFPCVLFSIIPPDLGELAFGLRLVRFVQRFFFLCWFSPFIVCRRRLIFLATVYFSVNLCSAGAVTQFSFLGCFKRTRGFGSYSGILPQRQSALPSFLLPLTFCSHSLDFLGWIHFRDQPLFLFADFSRRFCWILVCCRTQDQGSMFSPDLLRQLQRARSTSRFPLNFSSDLYDSFWFLFFLIKHHVLWNSTQVNPCCCCLLGLCES
jgi:hypothetical protein